VEFYPGTKPWCKSRTITRMSIMITWESGVYHLLSIYHVHLYIDSLFLARQPPQWARSSSFTRFLDCTQRRTTFGRSSGKVISSSQRPLPDNTQHSQRTNFHGPGEIRTHSFSRRAAVDLRLRPRGHWDRQISTS